MQCEAVTVRACVDRVLASPQFSRAARLRSFLKFIVEQKLEFPDAPLKERIIGAHVFDRPADYDCRIDPIVRTEARRLRAKLEDYYEHQGRFDEVRIEIPKGGYTPEFNYRPFKVVSLAKEPSAAQPIEIRRPSVQPLPMRRNWTRLLIAAAIALTTALALLAWPSFGGRRM